MTTDSVLDLNVKVYLIWTLPQVPLVKQGRLKPQDFSWVILGWWHVLEKYARMGHGFKNQVTPTYLDTQVQRYFNDNANILDQKRTFITWCPASGWDVEAQATPIRTKAYQKWLRVKNQGGTKSKLELKIYDSNHLVIMATKYAKYRTGK